eukprot:648604-Ditylum_brightwellii.AAC.1
MEHHRPSVMVCDDPRFRFVRITGCTLTIFVDLDSSKWLLMLYIYQLVGPMYYGNIWSKQEQDHHLLCQHSIGGSGQEDPHQARQRGNC